jgi:hypothetical protein
MATTQKTFLRFREQPASGTTSIHAVLSVANDVPLGVIKWRSGWRRYVFEPCHFTVFDAGCLAEIVTFITDLMLARVLRTKEKTDVEVAESTVPA